MNLAGAVHLNKTGITIFLAAFLLLFYYMFLRDKTVTNNKDMINLKELLSTSILAAEEGGLQVIKYKSTNDIKSKGKTKEGANDSVTAADLKSHCAMVETLKNYGHGIRVISEETVDLCDYTSSGRIFESKDIQRLKDVYVPIDDVTIWIDPLDATQEFTEGLLQYVTTMVCVAVKSKPVIGIIYQPILNQQYWAWDGVGVSKNLEVMTNVDDRLHIIVSRSHRGEVEDLIKTSQFSNYFINTAGGAGYKVLEVVKGHADVYIHITNIKKWDICSGNAILNALGGKMVDLSGRNIDYSSTSSHVHKNGLLASTKDAEVYLKQLITT